jgi:hypothetical protein
MVVAIYMGALSLSQAYKTSNLKGSEMGSTAFII